VGVITNLEGQLSQVKAQLADAKAQSEALQVLGHEFTAGCSHEFH